VWLHVGLTADNKGIMNTLLAIMLAGAVAIPG
jgi:hypothetical protein